MKQFFYESLATASGELTPQEVFLNFLAACVIGALLFVSYRMAHSGPVYSRKFNVSLVMLVLITTLIMNVIGNNIALSLGMVGALSIVRFRTAIKDPRDTAYIFWAIAVGVCCGVSDYLTAGIGSVIIFLYQVFFGFVRDNERILIVMKLDADARETVENQMTSLFSGKAVLRMENVSAAGRKAEAIYEISDALLRESEKSNGSCISRIAGIAGVASVSMVRQEDEINQ